MNSEATESGDKEPDVNNLTFICCENCEQFDILIYHGNCEQFNILIYHNNCEQFDG